MSSPIDKDALNRLPALAVRGTGPLPPSSATRLVTCQFEQYEVVFAATDDNQVVAVVEVREKKDFRSLQQKIASAGHFNVERYVTE